MTSQILSTKALRTLPVPHRLVQPFASTLTAAPSGYALGRYFATTSSSRLIQLQGGQQARSSRSLKPPLGRCDKLDVWNLRRLERVMPHRDSEKGPFTSLRLRTSKFFLLHRDDVLFARPLYPPRQLHVHRNEPGDHRAYCAQVQRRIRHPKRHVGNQLQ